MSILCVEPVAGASGNMILAALFDLGADPKLVSDTIKSGGLTEFEIDFTRRQDRHHLQAGFCEVRTLPAPHHHGHHSDEHHHHPHRRLQDIIEIIEKCPAAPRAKERASAIFQRLAQAEADVHGTAISEIHFHEVGAVDAIVDILGTCIALEQLNVQELYCAAHKVGKGTVNCAHGTIPVPAPATVRLLQGKSVQRLPIEAELTTPTGAAILTTLSSGDWTGLPLCWQNCGIGHGSRDLAEMPNIIRLFLCDQPPRNDCVEIIETDIDDQTPEITAALAETLLAAGALDVSLIPLLMKKGRPGIRLSVMASTGRSSELAQTILEHASTIGLRITTAQRRILPRQETTIETPWGQIKGKAIQRQSGIEIVPEYESARELSVKSGVSLRRIMHAAQQWQDRQ